MHGILRSLMEPRTSSCGYRSGAGMSATRCRTTAPGSTTSSRAGVLSRAGRCTATCSRCSQKTACRSANTRCWSPNVWLTAPAPGRIRIGGGTFLNLGVQVAAVELVEIGEHCMFANGCFVTDGNHRFDDPDKPVTWQGFTSKGPTRIGDNVWCGANVVVTSGVTIGERCVIGANSVVTTDLPPYSASPPARPRGCCRTIDLLGPRPSASMICTPARRPRRRPAGTAPPARRRPIAAPAVPRPPRLRRAPGAEHDERVRPR